MNDDVRPPDPRPLVGDEASQLVGFLAGQREILERKCAGLDDEGLRRTLGPSSLTLGGLLNHAALNEDYWFTVRLSGGEEPEHWRQVDWDADPDHEFRTAHDLEAEALRARYRAAAARSDAVLATVLAEPGALDAMAPVPGRDGTRFSNRWIILHMIEETARHAGHADLLRESIDGVTGE